MLTVRLSTPYRNLSITTTPPTPTPTSSPATEDMEPATITDGFTQIEDLLTPTYHPASPDFDPLAHRKNPDLSPKVSQD